MIIQGDCLEELKKLPDSSVDAIVTDPPYGLTSMTRPRTDKIAVEGNDGSGNPFCRKQAVGGFMGKEWDGTGIENNVDMWKECLRVLKPGGHLLSFGGTRTYHRMASAIEDAGFEVRDMIEWVYGCLSEDTEILTESGYKPLHKLTQYDRIGVYDITNNIYKWERPQGYSVYKVHQDTAYRIKSDYTDQIVSRNHRCLVEREGKLVFVTAEELKEMEYMPTLSEDFYSLQEGHRKLLLKELLWKGKRLAQKLFSKWVRKEMSEQRIEVRKEPSLERWSNLLEETRKLQADKICEVSEGVFTDGKKRWICNGTSFDSGSILGDMFRENPSSASYQSRPTGQPTGKSDVISIKQGTQITRRARVEKIEYSGIIFCPTVSTGAFIARRNGQVFITGNSGFPKSLNIGKAVDKLQGNEREDLGLKTSASYPDSDGVAHYKNRKQSEGSQVSTGGMPRLTKGTSDWEGWGTALKPAHEPICMARKPFSGTVAENVLKWGVGGINIDGCRVGTEGGETHKGGFQKQYVGDKVNYENHGVETDLTPKGRFPANLIHDGSEEVRECFPDTKKMVKEMTGEDVEDVLGNGYEEYECNDTGAGWFEKGGRGKRQKYTDNNTNASRFFKSIIYTAKASKSERNRGCEGLEDSLGGSLEGGNDKRNGDTPQLKPTKNSHPTVKPIALMEYLIKMVTREGQTVLDPFAGSGTTLIASKKLGRKYIGIELEPEYVKIAEARLKGTPERLV